MERKSAFRWWPRFKKASPQTQPKTSTRPGHSPTIPREVWLLWSPEESLYVMALDGPRGHYSLLAALNEPDTKIIAEHQRSRYGINCVPVRVK